MVQEIITYLIVAVAVVWAALKIYRRIFKPAKKAKRIDFKKDKITMEHNCTECAAADCALRDLPRKIIEKNIEECHDNVVPSSQ